MVSKNIWKGDLISLNFDFLNNSEKFKALFENIDKLRIVGCNSLDALKKAYIPSWNFYKDLILYAESDDEDVFYTEICKTLILTNSYSEIIKIKANQSLSNDKVSSTINRAIENYLESRDELNFYPSTLEWSQYINAPNTLIEEILKNRKPHLLHFLPMPDEVDFSIYFEGKMKKLYNNLKRNADYYELSFQDLQSAFIDLINGEKDNYIYYGVYDNLKDFFANELNLLLKYRIDIDNWKSGSLDQFYKVANENKLSNIDTVSLVLEFYFKELNNLDS